MSALVAIKHRQLLISLSATLFCTTGMFNKMTVYNYIKKMVSIQETQRQCNQRLASPSENPWQIKTPAVESQVNGWLIDWLVQLTMFDHSTVYHAIAVVSGLLLWLGLWLGLELELGLGLWTGLGLDMINHGRSWSTVLDQGHPLFNASCPINQPFSLNLSQSIDRPSSTFVNHSWSIS